MKFQRIAIVLSVFNLLFLVYLVAGFSSSAQPAIAPVVRARLIELIDDKGKVRASLSVEKTGEAEFRLRDKTGAIRAKFGAGDTGSAFILMDERTEATVQINANEKGGGISLFSRDGKRNDIK